MDIDINKDLIKQVAKNANLTLTDAEIKQFEADFRDVLGHFEKLAGADVSETPSFHPVAVKDKTREDKVKESLTHDEAMKNVKQTSDGYIRGPKVVK